MAGLLIGAGSIYRRRFGRSWLAEYKKPPGNRGVGRISTLFHDLNAGLRGQWVRRRTHFGNGPAPQRGVGRGHTAPDRPQEIST